MNNYTDLLERLKKLIDELYNTTDVDQRLINELYEIQEALENYE